MPTEEKYAQFPATPEQVAQLQQYVLSAQQCAEVADLARQTAQARALTAEYAAALVAVYKTALGVPEGVVPLISGDRLLMRIEDVVE